MIIPSQLGPEHIQALTAIVICQLNLCQKQLDILGANIAAAHIDLALHELTNESTEAPLNALFLMSMRRDYSTMDALSDAIY